MVFGTTSPQSTRALRALVNGTLIYRKQARPHFSNPILQAIPKVLDQEALEEELFRELPTVSPSPFISTFANKQSRRYFQRHLLPPILQG